MVEREVGQGVRLHQNMGSARPPSSRASKGVVAAYEEAGIDRRTGTRWQIIATLPEDRFEQLTPPTSAASFVSAM